MGIKGRGRSGRSRDSNPACQCCSSAHLVQCEPDEASGFTNPNVGPGTYASLRLKLDAWSSAVQRGQKCSSPTHQNPSYINVNSNHPKNIIKQIPKAVNLRIGKLSANEKIFKESSKRYIDALKNSGFKEDFRYLNENITNEITKESNNYDQKNKNRKRKIIWFNPPFCKLANIDVGKYFLRLIDKHFR